MLVLLQLWIIVCWQHFTMGVNVDTSTLCLLQQLLNILQVVTRNEDSRTITSTDVNLCQLWITICLCVCLIE